MSYEFYKTLHLFAVLFLMAALGGMSMFTWLGSPEASGPRKFLAMLHGIALLVIFVAGFGLMAKLGIMTGWPVWIWLKLGVWLLLGASVVVLRHKPAWAKASLVLLPLLAGLAAYFAIAKPA